MKHIIQETSWWGLCAVLLLGGCDCEDRVRRALSDPGARGELRKGTHTSSDQGVSPEPSSTEPEESEPNDLRTQATRYELGVELRTMRASLGSSGDQDWFLIGATRDELLEVSVEPLEETLDVSVDVMSSDDTPLRYAIAGRGKPEVVPWLRLQGGQAIAIKVTSERGQGGYRVRFRRHLSAGALEAEPDDIWSDAMPLEPVAELQGFYDRPGDRDRLVLGGDEGQVQRLEVSGIEGLRQRVALVRDERTLWSRELPEGKGVVVPNLGGGSWGLDLSVLGDAYSRDVPYRIKVSPVRAPDDIEGKRMMWEREPNDPLEQGVVESMAELGVQPVVVVGSVLDGEDRDVLGFASPGAEVVRVKLSTSGDERRVWMRLGVDGEQVWAVGERGVERCIKMEAGSQVPLEVMLGGKLGREDRAVSYRLEAWSMIGVERAQGEEQEPNDTMTQATMYAGAGIPWTGYILTAQDRDWYAFEVDEPEQLIALNMEAHELDLAMSLRDEEGGVVAHVQGAGAGGQEGTELRLPRGKYLVEVFAQKGSSCEPYRLGVIRK